MYWEMVVELQILVEGVGTHLIIVMCFNYSNVIVKCAHANLLIWIRED